jgi:hypothetical protein
MGLVSRRARVNGFSHASVFACRESRGPTVRRLRWPGPGVARATNSLNPGFPDCRRRPRLGRAPDPGPAATAHVGVVCHRCVRRILFRARCMLFGPTVHSSVHQPWSSAGAHASGRAAVVAVACPRRSLSDPRCGHAATLIEGELREGPALLAAEDASDSAVVAAPGSVGGGDHANSRQFSSPGTCSRVRRAGSTPR